jgi:AcrR family transcriptional regulator
MSDVRERIMAAAHPLFVDRSFRDVSIGEILIDSGATRPEFDHQFESRDALARECLGRRQREWTEGTVRSCESARAGGATPGEQLLAIFGFLHTWFRRDDFRACSLINVLLELAREQPPGEASILQLLHIRCMVATLAAEARLVDPDDFVLSWDLLLKGAIIANADGDSDAALRAGRMAEDLINRRLPASAEADMYWWMEFESGVGRRESAGGTPAHDAVDAWADDIYPDWSWAEA